MYQVVLAEFFSPSGQAHRSCTTASSADPQMKSLQSPKSWEETWQKAITSRHRKRLKSTNSTILRRQILITSTPSTSSSRPVRISATCKAWRAHKARCTAQSLDEDYRDDSMRDLPHHALSRADSQPPTSSSISRKSRQ